MDEIRAYRVETRSEPAGDADSRDRIHCLCGHDYNTGDHAKVRGMACPSCGERAKVMLTSVVEGSDPPQRLDGSVVPSADASIDDVQLAGFLFYSRVLARSLQDESDRWHLNVGVRSYIAASWRTVSTIRQILRLAEKVSGLLHHTGIRTSFDELLAAHPDLTNLRDGLEHWDEYLAGTGRVQRRRGTDDPWLFEKLALTDGGWSELEATFGPYTVGIADAARRSYRIALECFSVVRSVLRLTTEVETNDPDAELTGAFSAYPPIATA